MKVQRLFLRNVRNIKELDLDFRDPVTGKPMSRIVLAGANGSGKTTILECLFGLLAAAERYGKGEVNRYGKLYNIEITLPVSAQLQLLFDLEFIGAPPVTLSASYGELGPIISEGSIAEEAMLGGPPPPGVWRRLTNFQPTSLFARLAEFIQQARESGESAFGSVLYFPHNRYLPPIPEGELRVEPREYQWAYRYSAKDEWKGSIESYLFSLNYLDLEDRDRKTPANRFEQAVQLVNSVLDGKRIARVQKGRIVVETDKGETHGLDDLSSGEKQLVLLIIEIQRRVVPSSIILIDEPEISLHAAWQRGLVVALDKIVEQYNAQVIMATHSLEIASMVMPHEVISLNDLGMPLGKWEPEKEALA